MGGSENGYNHRLAYRHGCPVRGWKVSWLLGCADDQAFLSASPCTDDTLRPSIVGGSVRKEQAFEQLGSPLDMAVFVQFWKHG